MKELHEIIDWKLIGYACEYKGVAVKNMLGATRETDHHVARVLCSFMFLYKCYRLATIGKILNRNHATILHHRKLITNPNDNLVSSEIIGFREFLLSKEIRLPTMGQLMERIRINNK